MRNFFLTVFILLLVSCSNKSYFLKKRYSGGYRVLNSKINDYTNVKEQKNKDVWLSKENNDKISALNSNNFPIKLDYRNNLELVNKDLKKNKKQENYSNKFIHQKKHILTSSNQFKSTANVKKVELNKNYSNRIPLAPESGAFFYVWGIFGSIFLAIFLATLYFLIISGLILITYNPNLFLIFAMLFIAAAIIIGFLYLINAD